VAGGNGSFEFGKESYDQTKDFSNNGGFQGWNHFTESGRGGAVFVYNQSKSGGKNTATWAIPNSSPAGDVALGIKQDASAWTEVVVTQKGRYKLSFVASCRQAASGVGYSCDIAIGKDSGSLATAGVFTVPFHDGMYHPYEYMLPELEAGTYQLWFKSRNTGRDLCAVIDDVKLVTATDDDSIKVPNGDFEKCNYDKLPSLSNGIYWFYYASTKLHYGREALQDWVLTQDDGNAAVPVAYRGAAPVSARTTTEWGGIDEIGRFAELDGAGDSLVQLFMSSGCRASVSFTPPAGSYRVCASAAVRLADSKAAVDMSLVAGVTPEGSEKVELGEANLKNVFRMKQVLLPNVFTVDGNTEITLELAPKNNAGDHGYLVVDNVKLMRLEKFNQLANGDFEAKSANWTGTIYTYGSNPSAWGSDRASGGYCGQLQRTAVLSQDLTVPAAGLYRLRLMARTRQTTANSNIDRYGRNPVAVDLIDLEDGSSPARRIALFTPVYTNFTEFSWCVKVPKAGRYRLNLAGQSADSDRTSFIDDVSLVLENAAEVPEIPDDLALVVESGAKLRLDFAGTKKVGKVKLDGKVFKGTINAEKYPQYVSGDGTLCVEPKNLGAIFIR
jgi:hypothetical protein